MPLRSEWKLAREGVTLDTFLALVRCTALNPALTLPLLLLARYTSHGSVLAAQNPGLLKALRVALGLGLWSRVSGFLDDAVTNNWTSDTYDWSKEVVVVTGGSDGIGKIVVQLLAERGIKVAVLDVQQLTYKAPSNVHFFYVDLASPSSITSTCNAVQSSIGHPTILINNAGAARGKSILGATDRDIRLTFNVNTISHYHLAQAFLPHMIESNHGMVITVASMASYLPAPNMVDYAASKAAALAFHEGLAAELPTLYKAPRVRTVAICPGYTRTKLFEGFAAKALWPETVAEAIVRAVLSGRSGHVLLPAWSTLVAVPSRAWPSWMQYGFRKGLAGLMAKWQGRQVVQPSLTAEECEDAKGEKSVGESTVLVEQD